MLRFRPTAALHGVQWVNVAMWCAFSVERDLTGLAATNRTVVG